MSTEVRSDQQIMEAVQAALDDLINPAVAGHGGQISVLMVRDRKVFIRMSGGCQGCGMADVTLRQGVESLLREEVPEIVEIIDETNHADGNNPFYQPAKS